MRWLSFQEVPRALASLKYFCENAPQYYIVCASFLLGIALHEGTSFPVGKVDFLKLYPLSFKEFLMATGKERFAELLDSGDFAMITSFRQTYIDVLELYYFVGRMPEAVQCFADDNDFAEVRTIQKRILAAYEQGFSKHAPYEIVPKLCMLWLIDCGLVYKISRVNAAGLPLQTYEDLKAFKLFVLDVGLLGCIFIFQNLLVPSTRT